MEKKHGLVGKPSNNSKDITKKMISIRVDPVDLERWKSIAESNNMKFTEFFEQALNEKCAKYHS
ncbi:hypothetical protein [Thorsellia anophelis]|uniref:Uncharacterized protein n=1 Tax=Thorsellia anophelis DSM 18579 TaxID=1123402 RepID=A0A1I0D6L2_9GAMM|nr:hypothetical protein [Thorsellia anophelis]SET27503.1 hypothetical protein SAMN02583745_01857 [Thorsellia anophelis DSM 18579]